MSDPMPDVNEAVCWQCSAPAQSGCGVAVQFTARAGAHLDARGYPVVRGKYADVLKVRIPRCEACENRGLGWGIVFLIVFFGGAFLASWLASLMSSGFLLNLLLLILVFSVPAAARWFERLLGRRPIDDYPPLRRLREAGWKRQWR
jgi:cobalamin biosynthesis protein CobD/CbiB